MTYEAFLERKRMVDPATGMYAPPMLPAFLFPHQRDIVAWALRRGRAAIFAGTGLGKTAMELTWADAVSAHTDKPVLIFAPLAVSQQHIREAEKFGLPARIVKSQDDVRHGANVTNYQKIEHFDLSAFGGIVLDESSILKSTDGKYRTRLIEECASVPFRLAATATPAPNDFMELGNHAEFLGVLSYTDMLATFFVHDGGDTQKWRLKGHAENDFWKWMASWAVMLRKPSDLGYPDGGYDLPPLRQHQHIVAADYAPSLDTGLLFPMEARTMQERLGARRDTVEERVALAVQIVKAGLCDNLNGWESQTSAASTCELTTSQTKRNSGGTPKKKKTDTTSESGSAERLIPNTPSTSEPGLGSAILSNADGLSSGRHSASGSQSTTPCYSPKMESVPSATQRPLGKTAEPGSASITATQPGPSEAFSAAHATEPSANFRTTLPDCAEPSNTLNDRPQNRWVIWCQLNSEQDALERAFGDLCLSVRGSNADEDNERAILAFIDGDRPILIGKPSMMGFGLNLQCCSQTIFVGLNDSFEQVFQSVRRFWRFGQTKPVNVHFIAAETEGAVVANLRRKEADADRMAASMILHMADLSRAEVSGLVRTVPDYNPTQPIVLPDFVRAA